MTRSPLKVPFIAFSATLLTAIVSFAWTAPTQTAPNGNVAAPINTSSNGQVKTGDFATQGRLGAGTASPSTSYQLDVYKSGWKAYLHGPDGGVSIGPANSGWVHIYSDNAAQPIIFNTDVYTTTNGFSSYNGPLALKYVGSTVATVSSGRVDITGQLCINGVCQSSWPTGSITGSGSANYVARWTGASSLGTGTLSDDGSSATASGNLFLGGVLYDSGNTAYYVDPYNTSHYGAYLNAPLAVYPNGNFSGWWGADIRSASVYGEYVQNSSGYYDYLAYSSWGLYTNGNAAAGVYYDVNNTGYYMQPSATSIFNTVYANSFLYQSDRRLKENIVPLTGALAMVDKLQGVSFDWKAGTKKAGQHDIGVIAQDVESVVPEAVHTDEQGIKSVDYAKLVPVLINAIHDQQQEIDALKAQVAALKK